MTRSLRLEPLTAEAFASFGDVINRPDVSQRAELVKTLQALPEAMTPRLSFNHAKPWDLPLLVDRA